MDDDFKDCLQIAVGAFAGIGGLAAFIFLSMGIDSQGSTIWVFNWYHWVILAGIWFAAATIAMMAEISHRRRQH
jgi:hypothetical protein